MTSLPRWIAIGLAAAAPALAGATVLKFQETFGAGGLAAYGDRVAAADQGGTAYGDALGWTPNVTLDFVTYRHGPPSLYGTGYGGRNSLPWALGHENHDVPLEIVFTPDPGYEVRLWNWVAATWGSGQYDSDFRLWDERGSFDHPNLYLRTQTLFPNTSILFVDLSYVGGRTYGAVHFYLSNLGSVGLDDMLIEQRAVVPEPQAWALLALGLAAVAGRGLGRGRPAAAGDA